MITTRFAGTVINTVKQFIPRGYRKEYIPGWSTVSEDLYKEFLVTGDQTIADDLLHSLDTAHVRGGEKLLKVFTLNNQTERCDP